MRRGGHKKIWMKSAAGIETRCGKMSWEAIRCLWGTAVRPGEVVLEQSEAGGEQRSKQGRVIQEGLEGHDKGFGVCSTVCVGIHWRLWVGAWHDLTCFLKDHFAYCSLCRTSVEARDQLGGHWGSPGQRSCHGGWAWMVTGGWWEVGKPDLYFEGRNDATCWWINCGVWRQFLVFWGLLFGRRNNWTFERWRWYSMMKLRERGLQDLICLGILNASNHNDTK